MVLVTVAVLRKLIQIHYMIEALTKIIGRIPDLQYLIVGDGSYGVVLKELVRSKRFEDHVVFAG
jgi:glycosyltransferase involved in cell wall biosynthesis